MVEEIDANGDTPPKIIEPPRREPKESAAQKPKEAIKPIIQEESKRENELSKHPKQEKQDRYLKEKISLFAGIPVIVFLAVVVQYFYHTYYVVPLQERTLLNVVHFDIIQSPWITRTNASEFSLIHETGLKMIFEYQNRENEKLEFVWIKGNNKFGKLALNDSSLGVQILFDDSDWEVSLVNLASVSNEKKLRFITNEQISISNGSRVIGNQQLVSTLDISVNGVEEISLIPGKEITLKLVSIGVASTSFSEQIAIAEADYDAQFDKVFQLKSKSMPEFYQNMGKAALSSILSSLYVEKRSFEASGFHNSWFRTEVLPFAHLHFPEGCDDLRTQGLAALSIIDFHQTAVLEIITSWTNLVNTHGKIPTNVSLVADYKTKIAPVLFFLLDEYITKNGILELKSQYPNIEKLGLSLLDFQSSDHLFTSSGSFFFEKHDENDQIFTVEDHAIIVKASRVLMRLSVEYGNMETAKKFYDFNAVVDKPEFLEAFLTDHGSHANFIIKKREGKQIKEFISDSESLSPFIFQLLPPNSKELEYVLQQLGSSEKYWSNYGIRSHEGVSIAQNFMILRSLNYYSHESSPNQDVAHSLYARLRNNLIMFVAQDFKKTKTFWEYYSDLDGHGYGRKDWLPSTIILKIMAELY